MSIVLDGKKYSKELEQITKERIENIEKKYNKRPKLVTIMVGDSEASKMYVNMKEKACIRVGIDPVNLKYPDISTEELLKKIEELNKDKSVSGILIQHPLPKNIDEKKCLNKILPEKDVDGLTLLNFANLSIGTPKLIACTPKGMVDLLKHYNIELTGKKVLVIGRSQILGKPLAMMLLNENATVTIAHSKSKNIDKLCRNAEIICACVGIPNFVRKEWVKRGTVIVDAGYNPGNIGDVDKECYKNSKAYTPVPGGVGPMTITELLSQTVDAFEIQNNIKEDK